MWGGQMGVALSNRSSEPCLAALSIDSNSTHSYLRPSSHTHSQSTQSQSQSQSQVHSQAHSQSSQSQTHSHSQSTQSQSPSSHLQLQYLARSISSPGTSLNSPPLALTLMHAPRPSYAYELNPRPMDQQVTLKYKQQSLSLSVVDNNQ